MRLGLGLCVRVFTRACVCVRVRACLMRPVRAACVSVSRACASLRACAADSGGGARCKQLRGMGPGVSIARPAILR